MSFNDGLIGPDLQSSSTYLDASTQVQNGMTNSNEAIYNHISSYLNIPHGVGTVSFDYLTEGAANVIWLVRFPPLSSLQNYDSSLILRMRKDVPSTIPLTQLQQQFDERIAPLFSHNLDLLLPVHLIEINQTIIDILNTQLSQLEVNGERKKMRRSIYLPSYQTEPFAMVMPNIAHGDGMLVEFKSKWLVQSPSAPENASRCRTCALNAMRRALKKEVGRGDSGFCPFDLLSSQDDGHLAKALSQIWTDQKTLKGFVAAFRTNVQPALLHLQKLQMCENGVGLDDFQHPQGKDFSVAMALRDCSILMEAAVQPENERVDISLLKFLDLDLKEAGGGKLQKWMQTELELIEGGWYTSQLQSDVQCALSRHHTLSTSIDT